jgi:hypothetical protein
MSMDWVLRFVTNKLLENGSNAEIKAASSSKMPVE